MKNNKPAIGTKLGKLTVVKHLRSSVECLCECGQIIQRRTGVINRDIKERRAASCGCTIAAISHGWHGTTLYCAWSAMRSRCRTPKNPAYKNYGGRGIKVCHEWDENFEPFRDWSLANGYAEHLSIDRIDNDGNYEPGNCRWVSAKVQGRNKRSTRYLTLNGVKKCAADWCEELGIPHHTVNNRTNMGWSDERILTTPIRPWCGPR